MAQYLEVLSQGDKTEEVTNFYADTDGQSVQYVITPDDHQTQFPTQQILLVESTQLDQSQITYQALPQYTIDGGGGGSIQFTTAPQETQIFYMEGTQPLQQQDQKPQQIILNHQLGNTGNIVGQPTIKLPAQIRVTPAPQNKIQPATRLATPRQILNQQPRAQVPQQPRPRLLQQQSTKPEEKINEQQQAVALPDGTIVSVAAYKRLIAEKSKLGQQSVVQQPQRTIVDTPAVPKKRAPSKMPRGRGNARSPKGVQQQQAPLDEEIPRQFQAQHQRNLVYQQQQQKQQQQQQQQRPVSQANYLIQPPNQQRLLQQQQAQQKLPFNIPSLQIQQIIAQTPASEEYSDSIRMLVLLDNGEQRLITFTLPKEACTIVEILEQVNVPFSPDTNIQVTEANTNGINYIVTVGNVPQFEYEDEDGNNVEGEISLESEVHQQQAKEPSPEPVKEQPKFIPGKLALCRNCGYLSEDFNKCTRCNRKLPEDVKAIPNKINSNGRQSDPRMADKKLAGFKPTAAKSPSPKRKPKSKVVEHETVCLVSSDEETDDAKLSLKPSNEHLLSKLGASISISPITKEPSLTDIQKHVANKEDDDMVDKEFVCAVSTLDDTTQPMSMNLECRTVRIGSYRFIPAEKVLIESTGFTVKTPHPKNESDLKTVRVDHSDIVRVLICFNKVLPVIFFYVTPSVGNALRDLLGMEKDTEPYFNPLSKNEESHKRITLLPEEFTDEEKFTLLEIYTRPLHSILDELSGKEANDILVKTCPKDVGGKGQGGGGVALTDIKQILQYPPEGRGRLTINTEDYLCLASFQFLNDVIIDFYLKYLVNNFEKEKQDKVHVFSTFFYKRLTTKPQKASRKCQPSELDNTLTAAQKRHARVKTWTKNVNLFEKDFVIVPINEHAHWFLAIICFPGMEGCHTFDGQPYKLEPKSPRKKKETAVEAAPAPAKEKLVVCDEEFSDKDEAEGDDSDMDSDDSDSSSTTVPPRTTPAAALPPPPPQCPVKAPKVERPPIKQPCILIFDSLAGSSRSRVVATLRDYLTCEYKAKLNKERVYNKDNIKGSNVKVPQQKNFTDCGLYLLQYVEQFFNDPILDYNIPIKQLKNWFEDIVVTRKREDISELIKNLMMEYDCDLGLLPKIKFPTLNGKLVARTPEDSDEEDEDMFEEPEGSSFEDEDCDREPGEIIVAPRQVTRQDTTAKPGTIELNLFKPSQEAKCEEFNQSAVASPIKPDVSEFPRQTTTDKDTLNYLKAKRIIRHKIGEGPETKKSKNE